MPIDVFHNKDFLKYYIENNENLEPCEATLAATVETESLDNAYLLTNNLDDSWDQNKEVRASGLSRRSTSVGDIFQEGSKYFVVEPCGFRELSRKEIEGITFIR